MEHLEKAVKHIRKNVDMDYINFCICEAMEMRCDRYYCVVSDTRY